MKYQDEAENKARQDLISDYEDDTKVQEEKLRVWWKHSGYLLS
jgi:hypothetical protein